MSTPHSSPEKGTVDNARLPARNRFPDEPVRSDSEETLSSPPEVPQYGASEELAIISPTFPPATPRDDGIIDHEKLHSQNQNESEVKQVSNESPTDLPQFDWKDFEVRYRRAIVNANEVEDLLVEEFHQFVQSFSIWAQAAAEYDNNRAWKRLKTRERYVQLSENSLEEKKKHYVEVVQAFQKALALLSR